MGKIVEVVRLWLAGERRLAVRAISSVVRGIARGTGLLVVSSFLLSSSASAASGAVAQSPGSSILGWILAGLDGYRMLPLLFGISFGLLFLGASKLKRLQWPPGIVACGAAVFLARFVTKDYYHFLVFGILILWGIRILSFFLSFAGDWYQDERAKEPSQVYEDPAAFSLGGGGLLFLLAMMPAMFVGTGILRSVLTTLLLSVIALVVLHRPRIRRSLGRILRLDETRCLDLFAIYGLCGIVCSGVLALLTLPAGAPADIGLLQSGIFYGIALSLAAYACLHVRLLQGYTWPEVVCSLGLSRAIPWPAWCLAPGVAGVILLGGYGLAQACQQWAPLGGFVPASSSASRVELLELLQTEFAPVVITLVTLLILTVGQEIFFRGLLQPRLGLVRTSLIAALSGASLIYLFYGFAPAALVALLYGLISLLLGWVASRYTLWVSALSLGLAQVVSFWLFW